MCLQDLGLLQRLVGKQYILILGVCIFIYSFIFVYLYLHSSSSGHFTRPLRDADNITGPDLKSFVFRDADGDCHEDKDIVARRMAEEVRVLCWVMTWPKNHERKARHVKATWGHRCNILLFMSTANDSTLPAIQLPVKEGRDYLWGKTKEAFRYVYRHHLQQADWFMKADDDTYVIVENLRYMLSAYKPNEPIYFGCRLKSYVKQGFMSGGAGYVLSREAVRLLVENGLTDKKKCCVDQEGAEDLEMGTCLANVGVKAGDSRDAFGRGRFFPSVPEEYLIPDHYRDGGWYLRAIYYKSKESDGLEEEDKCAKGNVLLLVPFGQEGKGLACCSDTAISFHDVLPYDMYILDYLVYHLRPYGISHYLKEMAVVERPSTLQVNRTTKKVEASTKNNEQ